MQTTEYFRTDVLVKRPYLKPDWLQLALDEPLKREVQTDDGRIRHWVWIAELGKYLRVVTLPDGVTVHNAFPDRRFSR